MSMRKPVYSVYHSNKISSVHCLGLTKGEKMKIGILGFGHIGQYLYEHLSKNQDYQIVFVWNRTKEKIICVPQELILDDIDAVSEQDVELIIEVAHPDITKTFGEKFLDNCSYFIGSPTALANAETYKRLKTASERSGNPVYVPCGALWGAEDIARMARAGTLKGLEITMKKHPSSFKLEGDLKHINDEVKEGSKVLYEGSIRDLCPLAPNNVNTMAAAAIAAGDLGFDAIGRLVSDSSIPDWHIIEVKAIGPTIEGKQFEVITTRKNPAARGAVTGTATFGSFLSSVMAAKGKSSGFHVC